MKQRFDVSRFSAELRQVTRRLLSGPAFTVTAVLLLGSGLGVGTAFFNLVNGALTTEVLTSTTDVLYPSH